MSQSFNSVTVSHISQGGLNHAVVLQPRRLNDITVGEGWFSVAQAYCLGPEFRGERVWQHLEVRHDNRTYGRLPIVPCHCVELSKGINMKRHSADVRRNLARRIVVAVLGLGLVTAGVVGASVAVAKPAKNSKSKAAARKGGTAAPQLLFQLRKVRNTKGKVGCALFKGPSGFPMKPEKAFRRVWCPIVGHDATCRVPQVLTPGTYAAVCIHDENGNGKLDTNWIGFPTEGVVASNHAKGRFGPPSFKDASFAVGRGPKTVHMRIGY